MQFFKSNAHIEESNMQQTIVSLRQTSNAHIFHIGTFSLGRPHNIVQTQHFITGTVRLHITVQFWNCFFLFLELATAELFQVVWLFDFFFLT